MLRTPPVARTLLRLRADGGGVQLLLPLALAIATVAVLWPAFAHALDVWSTTEEFSYGFLIPPISLGVIWFRRQALLASIGRGATSGLILAIVSLAAYLG